MWIIGFAEGGFIGSWPSEAAALAYRDKYLAGRIANVLPVSIVSVTTVSEVAPARAA